MKHQTISVGIHLLLMSAVFALPLEPLMAADLKSNDDPTTKTKQNKEQLLRTNGEYAHKETQKLLTLIETKQPLIEASQKLESARRLNELAEISSEEEALKDKIAQEELQKEIRAREVALQKKRESENLKKAHSGESFSAHVSAYTAAADETGGTGDGITASGAHVQAGHTIACPKSYPFGTKVHFDGYGTYVCEDRGGAIKGNKFDMYMHTKSEAFAFGRRNLTATIVK